MNSIPSLEGDQIRRLLATRLARKNRAVSQCLKIPRNPIGIILHEFWPDIEGFSNLLQRTLRRRRTPSLPNDEFVLKVKRVQVESDNSNLEVDGAGKSDHKREKYPFRHYELMKLSPHPSAGESQ